MIISIFRGGFWRDNIMRGYIRRDGSYDIPYRMEKGGGDKVVIVAHGFASSKESPTVEMLMKELPKKGISTAAMDFPAHGESPADGDFLTVENCVRDLGDMADFVIEGMPRGGDMLLRFQLRRVHHADISDEE